MCLMSSSKFDALVKRIRMSRREIDNWRKNSLVKSETVPLAASWERARYQVSDLGARGLTSVRRSAGTRSPHLRIISHAAHVAIGRESFRNATNAMTPLRRIDMLVRARRSFGGVSGVGQRVASQAHNTRGRPGTKAETEGRDGTKLWMYPARSPRTMSNCRRDKGGLAVTAGGIRASPLLTARDNAETMAELRP